MVLPAFRLLSGKAIPVSSKLSDARVGDVKRFLAETLSVPHGRLQLLGPDSFLEDAVPIAALGLEDVSVCILPDALETRFAKYAGVASFDELQGCAELNISHKGLKVLPERFGLTCSRLKSLQLTSLQLRSLPDSFGLLSAMERLARGPNSYDS
ncbi:Leucine-rich repeat protein SHOC-2 [Durusdinium trenchii]|uniref:Leucine-rich repeat protein SHOC-2 n=1 Tax=Durusdinium trenchii TaxID=1381693 RepID=A0ABP0LG47_9DINO